MGLSMVVAQPYSLGTEMFRIDALGKPLILKIGDDAAVNTAVQTLQQYLGSYRIVAVTSEQDLYRTLGSAVAIFIVGHGNEVGVGTATRMIVTWNGVKTFLQMYSAVRAYIIACDAQNALNKYNINGFGTAGKIDAEIAALYTLVRFATDFNMQVAKLGLVLRLFSVLLTKPKTQYQYLPLLEGTGSGSYSSSGSSGSSNSYYLIGKLSLIEALYYLVVLTLDFISVVVAINSIRAFLKAKMLAESPETLKILFSTPVKELAGVVSPSTLSIITFMTDAIEFVTGRMSWEAFIWGNIYFILNAFGVVLGFIFSIKWHPWTYLTVIANIIAAIIVYLGTSSAALAVQLFAAVSILIIDLHYLFDDWSDPNGRVG